MGSLVAAGFFQLLEMLNWKTANPGQDFDDLETQRLDRSKSTAQRDLAQSALSTADGSLSEQGKEMYSEKYDGMEPRNETGIPVTRAAAQGTNFADGFNPGTRPAPGNELRYADGV